MDGSGQEVESLGVYQLTSKSGTPLGELESNPIYSTSRTPLTRALSPSLDLQSRSMSPGSMVDWDIGTRTNDAGLGFNPEDQL